MKFRYIFRAQFTRLAVLGISTVGCAGQTNTTRMVDDPAGEATMYGAPKNTVYTAELDAGRQYGKVTVYTSSRCDVIPVQVMQRYRETMKGDKVIERTPVTKKQVALEVRGDIPCDQSYARDVEVFLDTGADRLSLGKTNAEGQVGANLAEVFQVGSWDAIADSAKIMVRPRGAQPMVEAGVLSLAQLKKYSARVEDLLSKLREILAKGETGATHEEIARSYELYVQLQEIAAEDPRVVGLSARFWELLYGRKLEEARERMGKNLEALSRAKETLKVMGDAAIPLYLQAAVNSGTLDRRALEWSSLRLLRAIRATPSVCSGGFAWTKVPSYGWGPDARLAAQYTQYGYGSEYAATIQGACRTF